MAQTSRLVVEIDSRDAEQKAADTRKALEALEDAGLRVKPALDTAGKGLDGVGKSATKSTKSIQEERNEIEQLLESINPLTKKLNELERQEAALNKARKSGKIELDTYNEYSTKLKATRDELGRFNESLGKTGVSAKQTAAALRGVPAQFTDIAVSLQGGQAPLTVLLQQGGQLKDMFGGIGPAAKALGGYVLGLVNPFTVAAAAVSTLGFAAYKGYEQSEIYRKALTLTGEAAGKTSDDLIALSNTLAGGRNFSEASEAVLSLANNGRVTGEVFSEIARAATELAVASGKSAADIADQLSSTKGKVSELAAEYSDKYGAITLATFEQIRALEQQGDRMGAAKLLSSALADEMNARNKEMQESTRGLARAWDGVKSSISGAWNEIKSGLSASPEMFKLQHLQSQLQSAQKIGDKALIKGLTEQVALAQKAVDAQTQKTEAVSAEIQERKLSISDEQKWSEDGQKYRSNQVKMEQEISAARKLGLGAKASEAEIEQRISDIRAEYAKREPKERAARAYTEDAGTKMLDQARKQYAVLQQQGLLIDNQADGTKTLGTEAKKLIELEQQIADIKTKQTLTADQKSILAMAELNIAQQKRNADLEKEVELKKQSTEETRKLAAFQENLNSQLDLAREGLSNQLAGFGMGDKARQRLQEDLKIQQSYQKQMNELTKSFNESDRGEFSQDRYDKETAMIKAAMAERLAAQQGYYQDLDILQSDWTNGASAAWQDYVDEANDIAGQTYDAFRNAFDGLEDSLTDFVTGGKLSFKDLADSIIADIARIIIKTQVVTPLLNALFGGGGGGSTAGGIASLFSGSSSNGSSGGGLFSGLAGIGQNLLSAWNTITGVGSSVASGYATGGISGAISGGAGYYGNMLSNIASTLSGGFTSLIGGNIAITGATAAGTAATTAALTGVTAAQAAAAAATVGAEGITAAALQGAIAEGAASIGTNIGVAGATTAAASQGIAASISGALSSAAAMWPLAVIMGMYQSGKLYDAGVRPSMSEMQATGGDTALGKATMAPIALQSGIMELTDKINSKLVGGKLAAIISGSTLHQAVWGAVGKKLFGGAWETKDGGISLGVENGEFDAQQYIYQKKKGGLFSSSKKRTRYSELDADTAASLGGAYNDKLLNSMGLFSALGVQLSESVFDGLNVAATKISTKGKTNEAIQTSLDAWFSGLGDSAVSAINAATNSGLDGMSFEGLTSFVNNLYSVNAMLDGAGVGMAKLSVAGGYAIENLVNMAGGMDALNANVSSYYDNFTGDIQKSADSLAAFRAQFVQLGVALPESEAAYKAMVKQIDISSEAGRSMFTILTANAETAAAAYAILEQRQSDYYGAFYSEAENTARTIAETTAQIKEMGVTLPDSRDGFRDMVEALDRTTVTGKAMYDTLMSVAGAAGTVFDALDRQAAAAAQAAEAAAQAAEAAAQAAEAAAQALADKLMGAVTGDLGAVQRAITAQQKAATAAYNATNASLSDMSQTAAQTVNDLSSVSGSLESALKSLRGTSDDAVKMLRAQAQATLQGALATARSGGSLSGFTGLEDALETVSNNNTDLYGSMEDFARDQGRTANVVAELNGINGKQLTSAEATVKTLKDQIDLVKDQFDQQMDVYDQQLEFAQAQLDAINGTDNSIKSVVDAINAMNASVVAALGAIKFPASSNTPQNNGSIVDTLYQSVLGRSANDTTDAAGKAQWAAALQSGALSYADAAKAIAEAALAFSSVGYTGDVSQSTIASSKAAAQKYLDSIKGFSTGGLISGPGTGTSDSILSRLSNGEYVMTADAVRMFGTGMLDQMNAGNLPAFAAGSGIRLIGSSSAEAVRSSSARYSSNSAAAAKIGSGNQQGVIDAIGALQNYLYMITKYSEQTASGIRRQNEMEEAA